MRLPDLSREKYLVVDVETHDPGLTELGTNAIHRARGGVLLGYSVYVPGGFNEYFHHEPGSPAARWLCDQIHRNEKVIGANTKYDLLWLLAEKLWDRSLAKRRYGDVLINAQLLDENSKGKSNLNSQAALYGLPGKKEDALLDAGASLGFTSIKKIKENMHLMQECYPELVAEYANFDTYLTGRIYDLQMPLLKKEGLTEAPKDRPEAMPVLELEERFLPILVLMEAQGVKIDLHQAQVLYDELDSALLTQKSVIREYAGKDINFNNSGSLQDFLEVHYPDAPRGEPHKKTGKRAIKTGKDDLLRLHQAAPNPVIDAILEARTLSKFQGTFIKGYMLEKHVDGRLYPNIYQVSGEDASGEEGGTGTGRQSYSKPNLQNIPIRNKIWGPRMRKLFIPEDGCELLSADFSQQEPRWAVHWAVWWGIPGAAEAARAFWENPDTDWHGLVSALSGCSRDAGKILVLARTYCSGFETIAANLRREGVPDELIQSTLDTFDSRFGFLKAASKTAENVVNRYGSVRTWSGRKRRFDTWEPLLSWDEKKARKEAELEPYKPLPRSAALAAYFHSGPKKPIVRYQTYKAFNAIVQGSSADQTKQSVITAYYKYDLVPSFQVHDELVDAGIKDRETVELYRDAMINSIAMKVPSKVGMKVGAHWAK